MSSNEKERNSHSRGHGPMRVSEKPKDFMGSIKKLMKSLSSFKVLIFIALVLAALSSILSLIAPNKLSDLTDEITKGITINTSNMKELEEYAMINKIPIMQKDGILYLINYIKENNIKNILEIGSAIGYSSIMMASINSDIRITTIERDKDRYDLAVFNIKKYNLDKQINIIYGDAVDTDITGMYDLIFIDAAKGKNVFFFEKYKNNLVKRGTIITDNLSFHGLVEDESLVKTKNQRGIVNKIKDYINFLDNNTEFTTTYVPVGDKIAISKRKVSNE